ncbi:MAG: fibronectin type III domain-containing protein, partial [Bacteroidetes bacterium]|nr:fibronectin type III domain-containing protein [Bacteroidota bacterium]
YGYYVASLVNNREGSYSSPSYVTLTGPALLSAPTSLRSTSIRRTSINLVWSAPQNERSSPISGYRIQSSPDITDASNWSNVVANTRNTQTSYTVTGLSPNTRRFYRVYTINSDGESFPSNVISATTLSISVPAAPPGLTAQASGSSVILSWSVPDDGGSPITGYGIAFTD